MAGAALAGALLALLLPEPCDASCRGSWAPAPALRTPRAAFAAVALGGRVFAVGGCCPATAAVESAAAEDGGARLGAWRAEPGLLKPRARLGVAVVGGDALVALGGAGAAGVEVLVPGAPGAAWAERAGASLPGAHYTDSFAFADLAPAAGVGGGLCLLARCQPSRPPRPARRGWGLTAGGRARRGAAGWAGRASRRGRWAATSTTRNNFSAPTPPSPRAPRSRLVRRSGR